MPRNGRVPSYRHHKPSGQAVVTFDGRDYYLGRYDTPNSRLAYGRLIAEWSAAPAEEETKEQRVLARSPTKSPTVSELLLLFWQHALAHYRKRGRPTTTLGNYRRVVRLLKDHFGGLDAADFSPKSLKRCQQLLIDDGLSRKTINDHTRSIRHVFKWAVGEELVPAEVWYALQAVEGLKLGRTAAKENPPVRPVTREQVEAVRPHLSRQIAGLVDLMWYSGMRPGEAVLVRMSRIDTTLGDVWLYEPEEHKLEHYELDKRIWLGPTCQRILLPFRKADAERERLGFLPKRSFSRHYSTRSFCAAVERACDRAGIPRWIPNQLRHTRAGEIDRRYGREGSSAALGHKKPDTTVIYTDRNEALARKIALECG